MTPFAKMPSVVSPRIRSLPKRTEIACTLQLDGCRELPEYTILAHLRGKWAPGAAQKPHDFFAVYACDRCHDLLDGRARHAAPPTETDILFALYRSQQLMARHGLMRFERN